LREVFFLSQSFEDNLPLVQRETEVITSYRFGAIVIKGKQYTSDVIIYPEKIDDGWWRKEGHLLFPQDLEKVVKEKPEILIVGTGSPGLMKVPSATLEWIQSKGIDVIVKPTEVACQIYNQLYQSKKTIAVLHLTC